MVRVRLALFVLLFLAPRSSPAQSVAVFRLSWDNCASTEMNQQWSGPAVYRQVVSIADYPGGAQSFEVYIAVGRNFASPAWRCAFDNPSEGSSIVRAASPAACADALPVANLTARLQVGTITPEGPLYLIVRGELDGQPADPARRYALFEIDWNHLGSTVEPGNCGDVLAAQCFGLLFDWSGWFFGFEPSYLAWQDPSHLLNCPEAVPSRARTWGRLKTRYR